MAITKKTLSPFVVELSDEPVSDARVYAENAGHVTVYTGSTAGGDSNATIIGSGLNAALKNVAAGGTYVTDPNPGGGVWTGSTIAINGNVNISLNAVSVKGAIYGGALALTDKGKITTKYMEGVTATVNGDVALVLNNTNASVVYGGGAGYGAAVNGDVSISYSGGNVSKIYGGGSTGSVLNGDVSIFIDGRATGKIGTIYAGGNNSVVTGNATVTFTNNSGLYDNLKLGTVSGGGSGKAARIDGSSTLVLDNYSGKFKATIKDFDTVTISGKSAVILTQGQNKTMTGATYKFVINDATLGLQGAMLTWDSKAVFSNIVVSVETSSAIDVTLIQSKQFKTATAFNINAVLVVNADGEQLSSYAYELTYDYDKKLGGSVSISYKGQDLVFDSVETKKVVLSGAADEVSIVAGGNLAAGLNTGGGDDIVTLGNCVKMTGNIALGAGSNTLIVQQGASMTGTILFADGSTNAVTVNGAVMGFSGGDAATNNIITLSGDMVKGGGVGYWTKLDVYVDAGYWTKLDVFVVRDLILSGEANDTVIIGNGASVNNIDLGGGNDTLIINRGANIGYDYVSAADWTGRGNVIPATINLGTGKDVLVLNAELASNVNVITADDGGDVIVIGADMAINDNQLLVGSTNNTLVVMNGRQVTFNDVTSWGDFLSNGDRFDAFYLSQNAVVNFGDSALIENYIGTLSRIGGTIQVIGAPETSPVEIVDYYTAGTGVTNSKLYAQTVDLASGGKIVASEVTAEEVYVHGGTSIDNSGVGFVSVEDYILVSANASVSGPIYLGYEPIHELSSDATADIAGTVGAILGGMGSDLVNVTSGTASIGSIDLGGGQDIVAFSAGTFANAALVISNAETIALDSGADVTVGSAAGYADVVLGLNSKFTEVITQTVTIGDWDMAISFADGYTVRLNGTVNADATLTNNTVLITDMSNYFAGNIFLNGANTFSIQDGVEDWYDWQQFKFGSGATLGFKLGTESFFALDGFVGPTANAASIVASTEFGQNSGLGLGDWVYIKNWNDTFSIVDIQGIYGGPAYAPSLVFENLNVVAGAEIYGNIVMDNAANQVVINDGVVMNGNTAWYDYAAIETLGGDDDVTVGAATINGRILTGDGNDTVALNGTTINTAINQGIPAVDLGDGDDEIALAGATVNGSIAFGTGDDLLTSTGVNSVSEIVFGADDNTVEVTGGTLTAGAISFDGEAANNTIEVQAGATFNVESPVELVATGSNAVLIDGGEFGVAGSLALEGEENEVILSNGGHIAGLGELTMTGGANTLELSDSATSQAADTVVMTGSDNLVENSGTLTVTESVEMLSDNLNRIVNHATGSIQTVSLGMAGEIGEAAIVGAVDNVVENDGSLLAGSVLLAATNSTVVNNRGTASFGALMANGGVTDTGTGYQIDGSVQIAVENAAGGTLQATEDVRLYAADNALVNAGGVEAGNLLMAGSETFVEGVSDTYGAAIVNVIDNQGTGNLNTGDLTMFGNENMIVNEGVAVAEDIVMGGNTVIDLTNGSAVTDSAYLNSVTNLGTVTADSLSMAGSFNTVTLTGFVDGNNAGGTLDVAGDLVMAGQIIFESGSPALVTLAAENTIDLSTANAVGAVQTDAVTASLTAGDLGMIGVVNTINATASYDASVGLGATEGRTLLVGDVSQNIAAESLVMAGDANRIDVGVSALANGLYDADNHHFESRLELGTVAQTLDAEVIMNGSLSNDLNLGIDLTATEEGNLVTSGIAINTSGDISMEGPGNTLVAQANLTAGTQSVLEMQGDVVITMDSDISMRGSGVNTIAFGATLTETPAALPGESGGVIERNGYEAKVVVNGDITMVGTGAINMLDIGENTYYTGNVTMGEVYGDDLSLQNILNVADVGNIDFTSLSMTAAMNLVTLNGQGSIGTVNGIQGGMNIFTIGKDVEVNTPIVFRDIVDADLIGTEGYTILANTVNVVTLYGKAAGIDSSATNADDTFQVVGGLVTGDILTGSSANSDQVIVGGVTQADWDNDLLNDRQESVVEGSVTMGAAGSAGVNNLNILSSVVTDADGNEVGFGAGIDGDVTMTSTVANMLVAAGADTTPDLDGKFTRFGAEIGGSVTMNGGDNTAFLSKGSIGGSVTAVATGAGMFNLFQLSEFVVVGDTDLDAEATNSLTAGASILAGVAMTAVDSNMLQLSGSTAAGIVMTATDGFNTATVSNSATGSIAMTAEQDLNGLANINNRLDLLGQIIPAVDPTQEAPVVVRSTVSGDVTMTAVNDNTLNLGMEDGGAASQAEFGSVEITGALTMAALTNTIEVWAGTEASYLGGPSDGSDLDMRALVGSIAMGGQLNTIEVNQGALGVTTGGVTLANLDQDGDVIVSSSNSITVNDNAMLVLEEAAGVRQAISMGSKSVDYGAITTSGNYGDIGYLYVVIDASGYETYYYAWHDTSTTDPDTAAATESNSIAVSGKLYAGDLSMTAQSNTISVTGPAVQDPEQLPVFGYTFDVATVDVADVQMFGRTNAISATSSIGGYDAAFLAASVTMGDITVDYAGGTVRILAETNSIMIGANTFATIGDVSMTATTTNNIVVGNYTRLVLPGASDLIAEDGVNKLVGNPGDYDSITNPHIKVTENNTNTLGDVTMSAAGVRNVYGTVISDGANYLNLGQNSSAEDVTMTGYTNTVTLAGDTRATYYLVDPVTGEAVLDVDDNQLTETVVRQDAATIGDLVLHLPAGMAGVDPTNILTMGEGSTAASVTSTDTWTTIVGVDTITHGAVDIITLGSRAVISGDVELNYGNDIVTMAQDSEITGALLLGPGADLLVINGDATIGSIDFGTNLPLGDALTLAAGATLTVNGNIAFAGTLTVMGAIGASIVFADGFGFESVGDDARLVFQNLTVFGDIDSEDISVIGSLTVGNGTFSNGTMVFGTVGTLGILPQTDAEGQIIGDTFTVADTATVLFSDAGTWLYDGDVPVTFGQPTATDDLLAIGDDATLVLDGLVNFGTGSNQITLGLDATLEVNQAWKADIAAVNADGVPVNVDGQTEAEIAPAPFVPLTDSGTVAITMAHGSTLEANADITASGITLTGYYVADPEEIGSYTITGSGTITADIGVSDPGVAYKLDLSATVNGDLTFGNGSDTLTISADSGVNALAFGLGDDSLVLDGDLAATGLTYGGTLTVSGSGTVEVGSLTFDAELTTVDTAIWDVGTFAISTTVNGKLVLSDSGNDLALNGADLSDGINFGAGADTLTGSTAASTIGGIASTGTLTIGSDGNSLLTFVNDVTVSTGSVVFDLGSLGNGDTLMAFGGTSNTWTDLTTGDFEMAMDANILATDEYINLTSGFDVDLSSWNMDAGKVLTDVSLKIGATVIDNFTYDSVNDWAIASVAGTDTWKLKEEADGSLRLTYIA